ncbi:MAG: hypothetical protein E3J72_22850 [Planctomycetota bacterium]|nr:MAG: hypothetical protein E3J72_22850 [Planctomycetota bacterium]
MFSPGGCSNAVLSIRREIHELFAENRREEAIDRLQRLIDEKTAEHTDYFCLAAAKWNDNIAVDKLVADAVEKLNDSLAACFPIAVRKLRTAGIGSEIDPCDIQDAVFRTYHEMSLRTARPLAIECDIEIPDLWCAMFQFRGWYGIGADGDLLSQNSVGSTGIEWFDAGDVKDLPGMGILNDRLTWTHQGTYLALSDVEDLDQPDLPVAGQFHDGYAGRELWLSVHACRYTDSQAGYRCGSEHWLFIGGAFGDEREFRVRKFFTTIPGVDPERFCRGAAKICLVPQVYPEYEVGPFRLQVAEVQVMPLLAGIGADFTRFIRSVKNNGALDIDSSGVLRSTANPRQLAALATFFDVIGPDYAEAFTAPTDQGRSFFEDRAKLIEEIRSLD